MAQKDGDERRHMIKTAHQLQKFDIVKLRGRDETIVVGEVLGKYESSISIDNGTATLSESNPYPGCWAVKLLDSKAVVPISEIMYDVERVYRNGSLVYGK